MGVAMCPFLIWPSHFLDASYIPVCVCYQMKWSRGIFAFCFALVITGDLKSKKFSRLHRWFFQVDICDFVDMQETF